MRAVLWFLGLFACAVALALLMGGNLGTVTLFLGRHDVKSLGDGWTVITKDHSLSAQWEHSVLVTPTGYEVLTLSAGSPPPPDFVKA